jgi:general secretion pathway protein D
MLRGSTSSGMRRQEALRRTCCAPVALALLLAALPRLVVAQQPALNPQAPAAAAADKPSAPALPPPANPVAPAAQPAAGSGTSTQLDLAPPAAAPKKTPQAKPRPSEDLDIALGRPGELKLHGVSLEAALFMISEQWNINIVAGDVKGTVNGVFKDAPLREILDAILLSNGYNYRVVGKSLVISSIEQLGTVNPFFQSAIIPVQAADIDEVAQGAQLLKSPKGEVRPLKSAHSIVVLDFPDRVKMMRDFVATLDGAGSGRFATGEARNGIALEVGTFRTQHISAKTAEQALAGVLSKSGKATSMDKEDRVLVTDYADNLAMVEKVLASIDRPRPQVRITALIYDISLQDIENLGLNWNASLHGRPDATGAAQNKLGVDSVLQVPFQAGTAGSTFTAMNLNKHIDISAVILALQKAKDARLLADPNVAVLENEEALFKKVSQIPYQQLTQTQQGGQIGTTSFKEAGIVLRVTPKIASDGIIRMTVSPEVSRLTGFTPGDNQPIIDTNSASTVLSIANRQTVVIGGLRQRSDVGEFNGIPYLKDLNVVGRLFRSRSTNVAESELVVFISPEIISYADEPNCRQKLTEDTIRCRLDQIPQAEGCPPCCRRLPPQPGEEMMMPMPESNGEPAADSSPSPSIKENAQARAETKSDGAPILKQPDSLEPLSAARIPSAEFQFGAAGQNEHVRALVAEGRLRRLPLVMQTDTRVATAAPATNGIFAAPPTTPATAGPAQNDELRAAERYDATLRR